MSEKQDSLQPLRDIHPGGHLLDHHGGHADHPDSPEVQLQPGVLLVRLSHLLPIFPLGNFLLDVCGRLAADYQLINYLISTLHLTGLFLFLQVIATFSVEDSRMKFRHYFLVGWGKCDWIRGTLIFSEWTDLT